MRVDINEIFPNEISDETAHYLVNFFMDMALALESHYYGQIARYAKDNTPPLIPSDFFKKGPHLTITHPTNLTLTKTIFNRVLYYREAAHLPICLTQV